MLDLRMMLSLESVSEADWDHQPQSSQVTTLFPVAASQGVLDSRLYPVKYVPQGVSELTASAK